MTKIYSLNSKIYISTYNSAPGGIGDTHVPYAVYVYALLEEAGPNHQQQLPPSVTFVLSD